MMMRDDVSGVILLSVRVTAQHSHTLSKQEPDHSKTPPPHHFSSRFGSLTIQDTYVQSPQGDLLSHTNPDWCTSVLDPTVEHGFQSLTSLQTAQLTEAQGTPQILVSRIVTRSSKPWKPSSMSLPHDPASICTGTL